MTDMLTAIMFSGAFAAWKAWTADEISHKHLVQKAVVRLMHHHLHAAFSSWHAVSIQRSAERGVMTRAIMHMLNLSKVHPQETT